METPKNGFLREEGDKFVYGVGGQEIKTDLKPLEINGKSLLPIGVGGMAPQASLGVSGEVARFGGIGTVPYTAAAGEKVRGHENYMQKNVEASRVFQKEERRAAMGNGMICGNGLAKTEDGQMALLDEELVFNADLHFMGAGVDRTFAKEFSARYNGEKDAAIFVPIVSSIKALLLNKRLLDNAGYQPPGGKFVFYVERLGAAGHIGLLKAEHLQDPKAAKQYHLETIAEGLMKFSGRNEIIVLLGGEIVDDRDIKEAQDYGFEGTLAGTPWVNTPESWASDEHKDLIASAKEGNVITAKSPSNFWMNIIETGYVQKCQREARVYSLDEFLRDDEGFKEMYKNVKRIRECATGCLEKCGLRIDEDDVLHGAAVDCILSRLTKGLKGSDSGYYFAGKSAHRVGEKKPAKQRVIDYLGGKVVSSSAEAAE